MSNLLSACGNDCITCQFFEKACKGCFVVKGIPFWAQDHLNGKPCPIFDCSINKKAMTSCGNCGELPCKKFTDLKDPNATEKEHLKAIEKRVNTLRSKRS